MNGSWDKYLASPADFAGADDIITNLAKERQPGIEIIERTPSSLIINSVLSFLKRMVLLSLFQGFTIIALKLTVNPCTTELELESFQLRVVQLSNTTRFALAWMLMATGLPRFMASLQEGTRKMVVMESIHNTPACKYKHKSFKNK